MENASKALIIAGAILLAIVIISLGLIVVNNSRNAVDTANLSEQEIQTFNAKFLAYEGEKVSGSRVNTLIQQVIATNQDLLDQGKADSKTGQGLVQIVFPSVSLEKNDSTKYLYVYGANAQGVVGAKKANNSYVSDYESITNLNERSTADSALSVSTGKSYKVEIKQYKNGLVRCIAVE